MERFEVVHDAPPAVLFRKEALVLVALDGLAVTEMIVPRDGEAVFGQEAHEIGIALDVLGNAVSDLYYPARICIWYAHTRVQCVYACA